MKCFKIPEKTLTCLLAVLCLMTVSCRQGGNGANNRFELQGEAQGTYYSIIYYDTAGRNLQASIDSLLHDFDLTASLWVDSSLIRRINNNTDSIVNELFAQLLRHSVEMNHYTDGCFDCTVGKLVNLWGFGFSKREQVSDQMIDSLLPYVGLQPTLVTLPDGRLAVRKADPNVTIDFNAIAQGYSTDMVSRFLEHKGITNFLVDIGGEVYARGCKPDSSRWSVGIEQPSETKYSDRKIATSIALSDASVVTSGSYRKYYEKDGERYSHTIDPKTGRPVEHTLLSVTVVDSSAWRADALATAFMVMGRERALEFIREHPEDSGAQQVCFIYNEGGENKIFMTEAFKKLKL